MEVAAGPTLGYKGCGPGASVASAGAAASPAVAAYVGTMRQFLDRVTAVTGSMVSAAEESGAGSSPSSLVEAEEESSLSLSSSSTADNSGEEEVQSDLKMGAFRSLESLEDCLPIKRGLSNCFAGKSKSFASLAEAGALASAGCLAKPENPFNKRRRILIACKSSRQRRAAHAAPDASSPRVLEENEGESKEESEGEGPDEFPAPLSVIPARRRPVRS